MFRLAQKRELKTFILSTILIAGSYCVNAQIDPVLISDLPSQIEESSGLQKTGEDSYWTHNDTDSDPKIFNINEAGDLLEDIELLGVTPIDFEDVAYDGELFFYIGDFGNNLNDRTDLKIYRIPNPDLLNNSVNPELIEFSLSDQSSFPPSESNLNFDIEAMLFYDGNLHLFSKNRTDPFNGIIKHYRLSPSPGTQEAELVNSYFANLSPDHASITGADINTDGTRIALLSNTSIYIFSNFIGDDFFSGDLNYNFFNSTETREGITFQDNCKILISQEQNDMGNLGSVEQLNTCDILSSAEDISLNSVQLIQDLDQLKLYSENGISEISITDVRGKRILNYFQINANAYNWSTESVAKGIYLLTGKLSNGNTFKHKFLIK